MGVIANNTVFQDVWVVRIDVSGHQKSGIRVQLKHEVTDWVIAALQDNLDVGILLFQEILDRELS